MLVVAVVACGGKKEPPKPAASGSAPADAATVIADDGAGSPKPAGPVELTASYTSSIEVSSHVMNNSIKPEHLVDRDFNTAWNSKTGELAGAWLQVYVGAAKIHELRLTVGHTGKGKKGEDYFTMNPRIKQVHVESGGKTIASVTLDPENRGLQTVAFAPQDQIVKLVVDEVVMGTKKSWKEVCISELQAWGVGDPAKPASPHTPVVYVNEPPPPSADFPKGKPADPIGDCERITKPIQAAYDNRRSSAPPSEYADEDAPPSCGIVGEIKPEGGGPWKAVAIWKLMDNSAHGPGTCHMLVTLDDSVGGGLYWIGDVHSCGPWDDESLAIEGASVEDVIPNGPPELVLRVLTARADVPVDWMVCRLVDDRVQCTRSYAIETTSYKVKPRFSKGTVVFDPLEGKPPAEISGPATLVFDR